MIPAASSCRAVLSGARDRNASSSNMLAMGGAMSCTPAFRSPESLRAGYRPSFEVGVGRALRRVPANDVLLIHMRTPLQLVLFYNCLLGQPSLG